MRSISPTTPKRFGSSEGPRDGQQWRLDVGFGLVFVHVSIDFDWFLWFWDGFPTACDGFQGPQLGFLCFVLFFFFCFLSLPCSAARREMGASSISSKGNSPRNGNEGQGQLEEMSVMSQTSEPLVRVVGGLCCQGSRTSSSTRGLA